MAVRHRTALLAATQTPVRALCCRICAAAASLRLDGLVVSHLDQDHSGGAASIVRGMPVARILTSITPGHPVLGGHPAVSAARRTCVADSVICAWHVLHPVAADYGRRLSTNAMSCVVRFAVGPHRVLLTGDLTADEERRLAARQADLRATLLMVPHHGSRSSSSAGTYRRGRGDCGIRAGRLPEPFPPPGSVDRGALCGAQYRVSRTDRDGALQWRFAADGSLDRRRWRAVAVRYWHDRPVDGRTEATDDYGEAAFDEGDRAPIFGMP